MEFTDETTFTEWMLFGMTKGWCGPPICETHDGFPMSEEEADEFDEHGEASCMHMLRLYGSPEHQDAVEESHSPSQWRKHGW
jgi:hypothetical protein